MSLFQCSRCGCLENTALCNYHWAKINKEPVLCSVCGGDGTNQNTYEWHGVFERIFLPKGMFVTNKKGNLAHKNTGSENYLQYALKCEEKTS